MEGIQTYLASPWFSDNQMKVMNKVRDIILSYSEYKLFSPYYDGVVYDSKKDSEEVADKAYLWNVKHATETHLIVAIIDDFDPGVIFETGLNIGFWLANKSFTRVSELNLLGSKILGYSDVPDRGLNLMLKKAFTGFANGENELRAQLIRFKEGKPLLMPSFKKGEVI